ncbi:hypothetical protein HNP38_000608 [Chryseobacterium defluvii]|uniref:Intein n=1 Tax=Chryseobacterium defluvii TaxID=160396 RepID=A0A840K7Z4_9FLAO|nr:hypothetical protein [Chryseobacterium defluvii]MBB4805336.1 hypothetical protein [Chryseobacterium defluvii]
MKTFLLTLIISLFSLNLFSQQAKEMAVYAEKKDNDYYLVRLVKDQSLPKVYVHSNGITKLYKNYNDLKDIVMDFPGMMEANHSTKEELVSILKKADHFYEITSQRKDPKNIEKTIITVYEVYKGQKRIVEEYGSLYELFGTPYQEAIFIN